MSLNSQSPAAYYKCIRRKHAQASTLFALLCCSIMILGFFLIKPSYHSSVTLAVKANEVKSEWDILEFESQDTDFEEKILSRKVLEPAMRSLKLYQDEPASLPKGHFPLMALLHRLTHPAAYYSQDERDALLASAIENFKKGIKTERIKHSLILKITAKAKTPHDAAAHANAVAKSYIRYMKEREIEQIQSLIQATDQELRTTVKALEEQARLRTEFLSRQGWDDYQTDLQHAKVQVAALKNSLRFLDSYQELKASGTAANPSRDVMDLGVQEDASLDVLSRQLSRADNQLNNVSSRHSSESLGVLQARFEKEWLDSIFKRQIGDIKQRRAKLEKQLALEKKRLQQLMTWEPKARTLEAEFVNLEQRYQTLLKQKNEAEFKQALLAQSKESEVNRLQILDPAAPPLKKNPAIYILKSVAIAFFTAFLCYLLLPFVLELLVFTDLEIQEPVLPSTAGKAPFAEKAVLSDREPYQKSPVLTASRKGIYSIPSEKGGYSDVST